MSIHYYKIFNVCKAFKRLASSKTHLLKFFLVPYDCYEPRCGTVTIFYGSDSGSIFDKLRFRLRIKTIKSTVLEQILGQNLAFLHSKLVYKGKLISFNKFLEKWE